MIKIISCAIAFILLLSSVLMHFFIDKKDDFILTLNDKQKKIYKGIIVERFRIYIFGMILGLLLGFSYIYFYFYSDDKFKVCKFVMIVLVTKLTFYYFYPKSDFMLYHLTEKKQVSAWTDVYRNYKNAWRNSLLLATLSYIIFSFGF